MSTFPTSPRVSFLLWCESHTSVFVDHAAEIGLSPVQAGEFEALTDALAARELAKVQARQAFAVAVQSADEAFRTLRAKASAVVGTIRSYAESSGSPATVYNTAQIAPPAAGSPAPPPAMPRRLGVALEPNSGSLTLSWKASNPDGTSGTSYLIRRRLPGEDKFSFVGVSGKKFFVDDTLVAGTESVQYTVQGQRANSKGPVSPILTVNFGRSPDGERTASVSKPARVSVDAMGHRSAGSNGRRTGQAVPS